MFPSFLIDYFQNKFEILKTQPVGGGSINESYLLETSKGNFFLKLNDAKKFPGMFEAEMKGLKLLAATETVKVPEVCEAGRVNSTSFLLMHYIEKGAAKGTVMFKLGEELAKLHRHSSSYFGLDDDNYIGSLPQCNAQKQSWAEFFIEMRLLPMLKLARNAGHLSLPVVNDFEKLFGKLHSLFPAEKPSLLHGDLWGGNYLVSKDDIAYIIDPAVYYGHREMDLAMSKLFGGFSQGFYSGYKDVYPLETGWEQRIDLCNLYPLLVHVNLFGEGYVSQLKQALGNYV